MSGCGETGLEVAPQDDTSDQESREDSSNVVAPVPDNSPDNFSDFLPLGLNNSWTYGLDITTDGTNNGYWFRDTAETTLLVTESTDIIDDSQCVVARQYTVQERIVGSRLTRDYEYRGDLGRYVLSQEYTTPIDTTGTIVLLEDKDGIERESREGKTYLAGTFFRSDRWIDTTATVVQVRENTGVVPFSRSYTVDVGMSSYGWTSYGHTAGRGSYWLKHFYLYQPSPMIENC